MGVPIAFRLLALPVLVSLLACGAPGLDPSKVVVQDNNQPPTETQGTLGVFPPPFAEYPDQQGDLDYALRIDGKDLVDTTGRLYPVSPGSWFIGGNYEAGVHHFEVLGGDGVTLFAGDGEINSGEATRLFLYWSQNALHGSFVLNPFVPAAGRMHISAVNLVTDGGAEIQVVSCADVRNCSPVLNINAGDATASSALADDLPPCPNTTECTAVSPPLALGDTFEIDLPASCPFGSPAAPNLDVCVGYWQVPTPASLPNPLLEIPTPAGPIPLTLDPTTLPATYVVSPEIMMDGNCLQSAD